MSHLNTDHTCNSPEITKIFQSHYSTVNQWPSQYMFRCLATGSIALGLQAVQQCGCKIIDREQKRSFSRRYCTLIKTATKTEAMFCNTWHKQTISHWTLYFQDDFLILLENWLWGQRKLTASATTSTGTRSSEVDLSPQYSTKSLRLRTIIVQLVTIKVTPH